jgi:phospholipase D1/2
MTGPGVPRGSARSAPILKSGQTCWRQALADRFALIVDAEDYFMALKAAMTSAEKTIFLIGWDFDFRIHLDPGNHDKTWPDKLGALINELVKRKPDLEIRLLKWDLGALKVLARGTTPLFLLGWMAQQRVHLSLDHAHPPGACHHQKIVVIDDAFAFCGGIDVTIGRWDTRAHRGKDNRRVSPWGFAQEPWHDATAAVDGEAAQALGFLARDRWRLATGETLPPPEPGHDAWPPMLKPNLTNVMIGIARTQPHYEDQRAAHEIEALYLAAIGAARRSIYIESQYCASRKIGEALARRLAEKGGPEIVIVNPKSADGWLEKKVMGAARKLVAGMLRDSDREDRFRIYYPVAADGTPIYVHAKIMIVDDRLLKIGSSNLNNRSMGFDTECDLAIEASARAEDKQIRAVIAGITNDLLAEHLDVEPGDIETARTAKGTLIGAIEKFARPRGRTLKPLKLHELNESEKQLTEAQILDPERPARLVPKLKRLFG